MQELWKVAAAALASALVQVGDLLILGGGIGGKRLVALVAGTVLVRVAGWAVATYGPKRPA